MECQLTNLNLSPWSNRIGGIPLPLHYHCKYKIDPRSKFLSTIYEELPIYFLESKLKKYQNKKIGVFSKNIISSLNIDHNSEIHFKHKDVDLCFGKEVEISIEGKMQNIVVPIIAIEVKTYLDRTMLNEELNKFRKRKIYDIEDNSNKKKKNNLKIEDLFINYNLFYILYL